MKWNKYINAASKSILTSYKSKFDCDVKSTSKRINKFSAQAKLQIKNKQYVFSKWQPQYKLKKDGGKRLIISPPLRDRIVLKAITMYLSDVLSDDFNSVYDISYAYQKGKSVMDALMRLKELSKQFNVILKVDIRKFFDNIDKEIISNLLTEYNIDEYVFELIINSLMPDLVVTEDRQLNEDACSAISTGIPQGNALSSILSNLYLLAFDKYCKERYDVVRYADDMVFFFKSEYDAQIALTQIKEYLLENRHLQIHELKSCTDRSAKTAIYDDLSKIRLIYLGVEFDGYNLYPTGDTRRKLIGHIKSIITKISIPTNEILSKLKNKLNQWCGYYAFTDITDGKLQQIGTTINKFGSRIHGSQWRDLNIVEIMNKMRRRHKISKVIPLVPKLRFGDEYSWLIEYEAT